MEYSDTRYAKYLQILKEELLPAMGCAAKIASAVDAGLLALSMYRDGNQFYGGDGIVKKGVENTIATVGRLARFGMEQTDKEIISLMMEN